MKTIKEGHTMKAKHTPGPWRVKGNRIEYGPHVAGSGWNVAEVRSDYDEPLEANAALIAAAPCLYQQVRLFRMRFADELTAEQIKEVDALLTRAEGAV